MRAPSSRLVIPAAAAAVLACTVWDGRATLRIEPAGTLVAASTLALRVESERDLTLEIVVDDAPLAGTHRTNADLVLGLAELTEGDHVLRVRERGGAGAVESGDRALRIDRTAPTASFVPGGGMDFRGTPFTTTVRFTEAIDPASLDVQAFVATLPPGDQVLGVTLSADAMQVDVSLSAPTFDYGGVYIVVTASDALGNAATHEATYWPREFGATVVVAPKPASGLVTITVTSNETPGRLELWMRGALVAVREGGRSPWAFEWDASQVPSGTYPVDVRAPGWITKVYGATVVVDHDPPVLVSCEGSDGGWYAPEGRPFLGRYDCIRAVFDQELQAVGGATVRDGDVVVTTGASVWKNWMESCPSGGGWPITAALTLEIPAGLRDPLGNATAAPVLCTLPVPRWLAYWESPLPVPAGPIVAKEVAGRLSYWPPDTAERALLLWTEPGGDGRMVVRNARAKLGEAIATVGGPLNVDPAASASGLVVTNGFHAGWIERAGSGAGLVRARSWDFEGKVWKDAALGPLNRDPTRDATGLAADASRKRTFAWLEEVAGGGRVIETVALEAGVRPPFLGAAGAIPAAVAISTSAPKVDPASVASPDGPAVAWVEREPDGKMTLRAAVHDGGAWWPAGGALNLDPRGAVSEPALYARYAGELWLAWIEDGAVLVRWWAIGATDWTAPEALGSGDAIARSPRFAQWAAGMLLGFVERRDGADRIEVRARRGDAWTVLESPNAGAEAPIAAFDLGDGVSMDSGNGTLRFPVTWADDAGHLTYRVYNGP